MGFLRSLRGARGWVVVLLVDNLQLSETSAVWSDVLCVSGDVIFFTLKSMLHARQNRSKKSPKSDRGAFLKSVQLSSTILSGVILNLFERQEDRGGGCKK